jgi:hypothetical protein
MLDLGPMVFYPSNNILALSMFGLSQPFFLYKHPLKVFELEVLIQSKMVHL